MARTIETKSSSSPVAYNLELQNNGQVNLYDRAAKSKIETANAGDLVKKPILAFVHNGELIKAFHKYKWLKKANVNVETASYRRKDEQVAYYEDKQYQGKITPTEFSEKYEADTGVILYASFLSSPGKIVRIKGSSSVLIELIKFEKEIERGIAPDFYLTLVQNERGTDSKLPAFSWKFSYSDVSPSSKQLQELDAAQNLLLNYLGLDSPEQPTEEPEPETADQERADFLKSDPVGEQPGKQ